jgi:hypothetical protein
MKYSFIIILSFISILLADCKRGKIKPQIQVTNPVQIDSLPGLCPYLTRDAKGNIVLSWVRTLNDSTSVFCYAISTDGKTFGNPVVIPSSSNIQPHSENLPKIIFKPSGEIIALWGAANPNPKNKYSGLVFYVQSFDDGKTWTDPKPLIKDTAGYDQRYYDIALLSNGEVGIIWLDNRKTDLNPGSALYFASSSGRDGFQNDRPISQSCCQCCRTDLFVDKNGHVHVLYRGIEDSIRDIVHSSSIDGGQTFSAPRRISKDNWVINGCPHTGPSITENSEGLHFAWFTGGQSKGAYYASSVDDGKSFTPRESISGLGSHPQIASFQNGELIVVWDESVEVNGERRKRIGVNKRSSDGAAKKSLFITPDTLDASYPVVSTLNKNSSIIAYSRKSGDKQYTNYQVISFE